MSKRGLAVALVCGLLGLAAGAVIAAFAQPRATYGRNATPVPGVAPSVPTSVTPPPRHRPDITYPTLSVNLPLPVVHTIRNRYAVWTYHVPQGWVARSSVSNGLLTPRQIERSTDVRFSPAGEPPVGGYSLYVKTLYNVLDNVGQEVSTKITGFGQAAYPAIHILRQDGSSVYFTYIDPTTHYLRYNFFQWFAVTGQPNATLQVSVAGRKQDASGLRAMLNRFADNATGALPPAKPPKAPSSPSSMATSPSASATG